MKRLALISCMCFSLAYSQGTSETPARYKVTLTYGVAFMSPDQINDHITTSNDEFGSSTRIVKSIPESAVMFIYRPTENSAIMTARASYLSFARTYDVAIPETSNSDTVRGITTGSVREQYTVYPMSLGIGLASSTLASQIEVEFMYGVGYIDESQTYITSGGARSSSSRTLRSTGIGIRIAGQATVNFTEHIGLTFELGYRGLSFSDFEDQTTGRTEDMKFNVSGASGAIGLSILF